jgi:hypothetical protein
MLSTHHLSAQLPPVIKWQKTIGGSEGDGGGFILYHEEAEVFYISSRSFSQDGDFYSKYKTAEATLMKVNSNGDIFWKKRYGEEMLFNWLGELIITFDNHLMSFGSNREREDDNNIDVDEWIVKFNLDGDPIWEKQIGGNKWDNLITPIPLENGDILLFGTASSSDGDIGINNGLDDGWIIRLDSEGEIVWSSIIGSSASESFSEAIQVEDGFIVGGGINFDTTGRSSIPYGEQDVLITKVDERGQPIWSKVYGGSRSDFFSSLTKISNNRFLVSGFTYSGFEATGDLSKAGGAWLFMIDGEGEIVWSKLFGGSGKDEIDKVLKTSDGQLIIFGRSTSNDGDVGGNYGGYDIWMAGLTEDGAITWKQNFGGNEDDYSSDIVEVRPGEYFFTASTKSSDEDVYVNKGDFDIWMVYLETPTFDAPDQEACQFTISPTAEQLYLDFDASFLETLQVKIHDVSGRLVYKNDRVQMNQRRVAISLTSQLAIGQYFVSVYCATGRTTVPFQVH